ncbi:MAG: ABC transporter ATP-binding protein [Gammaproteobacteria bacterium]|nr:ABC transporter ATP-binding protein [Gammaproteobacteria bacterium]
MKSLLKIVNVTLEINKTRLFNNLTFDIQRGEIWGILGPNGSGKTTLLHTLAGLLPVIHGNIFLQEKNLCFLSRKNIAQQLGILFQENQDIFPQTVWEVCQSGRYAHPYSSVDADIIKQALIDMGLDSKAQQFIQTLSGGERKRLGIATLLAQKPLIYLLDEPINHLDLHYQVKILNHLKHLVKNTSVSVLMSLHDINMAAQYCQKILLLGKGEYRMGDTHYLLTSHNLTHLYQYPIKQMCKGNSTWWQPEF